MPWKCNVEGHEEIVVSNPAEAKQFLSENGINGHWRTCFDPIKAETEENLA